jgi:predicted outer membrane repeat protein
VPANAIVVNTFDQNVYPFKQNGNCSLGEAIWAAQTQQNEDGCVVSGGSTTIYLPKGTYTLSDPDTSSPPLAGAGGRLGFDPGGFPVIYTTVTILGNGSTIQRKSSTPFAIFQATAQADLTLDDLTMTGGDTTYNPLLSGGAIDLEFGRVTLNHVVLTGNSSASGGAIHSGGELDINDSIIEGNQASTEGAGIDYSGIGFYFEGGSTHPGELHLKDSQIIKNVGTDKDGTLGGGIYAQGGQVTIDHSLIQGNNAAEGAGLYDEGGTVNVLDGSVFSGNVATEVSATPHGGGGINGLAIGGEHVLVTIQDSYVVDNQAPESIAGAIFVQPSDDDPSSVVLTISHSVIAGNVAEVGGGIVAGGKGSVTNSCLMNNKSTEPTAGSGADIDGVVTAANNWWGTGGVPSVSSDVATSPLLTSPPDICAPGAVTPYPTSTPAASPTP